MANQQYNFRLPPETNAEINRLMEILSISTRTSVVRLAIRRMTRTEGAVAERTSNKPRKAKR